MMKYTCRIFTLLLSTMVLGITLSACSAGASVSEDTSDETIDYPSADVSEPHPAAVENAVDLPKIEVIDFSASWCQPCQQLAPYFEKWANVYQKYATFRKVDIDQNQMEAEEYDITVVPTIIIRDANGNLLSRTTGFDPKGIEDAITGSIKWNMEQNSH